MKIGNLDLGKCPLFLAPMEDVTDPPFRQLCKQFGADVVVSEFISSQGLVRKAPGSRVKLDFRERERPIGIQIFGEEGESMRRAAMLAEQAHPDFIDINFGCPVRKVVTKGAGAAFLNDVPKMVEVTAAVVRSVSLPVTIKTRLGWDEQSKNIEDVAERLQDTGIQAITIHGRTRAQLYGGEADWTLISRVKHNPRLTIPVIGNGDIDSAEKALRLWKESGVDGLMIGRAAVGNPWIFSECKHFFTTGELLAPPSLNERIRVCLLHLQLSMAYEGERKAIFEMRRQYAGYFKGFRGIKEVRNRLMRLMDYQSIEALLNEIGSYDNPTPAEVVSK